LNNFKKVNILYSYDELGNFIDGEWPKEFGGKIEVDAARGLQDLMCNEKHERKMWNDIMRKQKKIKEK